MYLPLALGLSFLMLDQGAGTPPVRISLDASSQQPGELILVTVETEEPSSVAGMAFGNDLHFFQSGSKPTAWRALLGIDVDVQPGGYPLELKVVSQAGVATRETRMLKISRRVFATRYLTLPEKYVNPPAEVQERIRRETAELKAIFSTASPERLWQGGFRRPVTGKVISSFGKRSVLNGQPRSVHAGVDLQAPMATALRAPAGGRVVLVKELYFAGNSIVIDHGLGLYSQFAHLSSFRVKEGQLVRRGEVIGFTGKSGRVQGPHLHWSVKLSNSRIDPMSVLSLLADVGNAPARRKAVRGSSAGKPAEL